MLEKIQKMAHKIAKKHYCQDILDLSAAIKEAREKLNIGEKREKQFNFFYYAHLDFLHSFPSIARKLKGALKSPSSH